MKDYELLEYIKQNNIQTIEALANYLNVSNATARRRLNELEIAGLITLIRGGSFELVDELLVSVDDTFKQKQINLGKKLSGKIAASLVEDGDIIFIDNGTTVRQMLPHLENKDVKIYTNGIYHVLNNRELNLDINIIPGELIIKEASIVGSEAISYLSGLVLDKVFVGINGFDDEGVYTPHRREMVIKEFALRHGKQSYIVTDNGKRGIKSKYKVCERDAYQIITETTI